MIKKYFEKIASSYWLLALINIKDIVEIVGWLLKSVSNNMHFTNSLNLEWIDIILKSIFAFGVIQVFRLYRKTKDEFDEYTYMNNLVNHIRFARISSGTMKFVNDEFLNTHLQEDLDIEIQKVRKQLQDLLKYKSTNDIEVMIGKYYSFRYKDYKSTNDINYESK